MYRLDFQEDKKYTIKFPVPRFPFIEILIADFISIFSKNWHKNIWMYTWNSIISCSYLRIHMKQLKLSFFLVDSVNYYQVYLIYQPRTGTTAVFCSVVTKIIYKSNIYPEMNKIIKNFYNINYNELFIFSGTWSRFLKFFKVWLNNTCLDCFDRPNN